MAGKKNQSEQAVIVKTPEQIMRQLHTDLKYWQRQLRLDDIEVELRWLAEQEEEDSVGRFWSFSPSHRGIIGIRHPDHFRPVVRSKFNADFEVILVHEMLHLRECKWKEFQAMTDIFEANDLVQHNYEISLDAVAEALVRARRGITR